MDRFIELMADIMEVDAGELNADTDFREACEFESLMGFSMLCMLEEEYGTKITVDQFLASRTIGDLYAHTQR